jgi:hypothetical protein
MIDFNDIVWPDLSNHYLEALKEGTEWIINTFHPLGIIATGTIVRGNPDVSSDFDISVIHDVPFRQRIQKKFKSIPFEIFINPAASINQYFDDEYKSRRPCTAHMLATGHVLINKAGIVTELIEKAKTYLIKQPDYDNKHATILRYTAASLLEDAIDIKNRDLGMANIYISDSIKAILDWFYYEQQVFMPRKKELLMNTEKLNHEIGEYSRKVMESVNIDDKIDYLKRLADLTIKTYGFFEWESERETIAIIEKT